MKEKPSSNSIFDPLISSGIPTDKTPQPLKESQLGVLSQPVIDPNKL